MRAILSFSFVCLGLASNAVALPITVSSYTYDGAQPGGAFTDPGNAKLTNGVLGTTAFNDGNWVGFDDLEDDFALQPQITFDLGSIHGLSSVNITYLVDNETIAIHAPDSANITFSDNGVLFSATPLMYGGFTNVGADPNPLMYTDTVSLLGNSARFVRMQFFNDAHWTFLSEVSFDSFVAPAPVPEPATFVLLGVGLAGIARRRRRRQESV